MSVLTADGLHFAWPGGPPAVVALDLALARGELLAVIGPNGAGKSTLVRLLAGLLRPDRGTVRLEGRSMAGLGARERARHIAVVPQGLVAVPEVHVFDFVLGGRYGHLGPWRRSTQADLEAVRAAVEAADVAGGEDRLLRQLSGGQLQRVLIARALAQEAGVLLVDEPTSSLDPEHQIAVFALLERLVQQGRAGLVVTHDLNLASQFATRVLLMECGRCMATGPVPEVLRRSVLEPVYGDHLRYGDWPEGGRPFVVPWLERGIRPGRTDAR